MYPGILHVYYGFRFNRGAECATQRTKVHRFDTPLPPDLIPQNRWTFLLAPSIQTAERYAFEQAAALPMSARLLSPVESCLG